jgi:hypothetical protein
MLAARLRCAVDTRFNEERGDVSIGGKSSGGIVTHSKAPNRIIEYPDGAVHVSINRKQRGGYYVAMMILPDGRVSASSKAQRKDAVLANAAALGYDPAKYHGRDFDGA